MKNEWKEDFLPSCLAGAICGITCLLALLFLAPGKWYYAFIVAVIMTGVSLYSAVNGRKKDAQKYKRDERLIQEEWLCSAEGYIRRDSDRKAKFYFGEEGISALSYKNVRPIIDFYEKDAVSGLYFDRCGWLAIMMKDEKMRLVIPKDDAKKIHDFLLEKGFGKTDFFE